MNDLNIINNRIGYLFNFPLRIGGYFVAAVGLAILLTKGWGIVAGIILIFAGLYFAATHAGILIDPANKAVRHYTSYFGLRYGTWKEYPTYSHICVIRREKKKKRFFEENEDTGESPYQFEVCLVSRSFRGKVLLEILNDRESAEFRASRYAEDMTALVTEYVSPGKVSGEKSGKSQQRNHGHSRYKEPKKSKNNIDD